MRLIGFLIKVFLVKVINQLAFIAVNQGYLDDTCNSSCERFSITNREVSTIAQEHSQSHVSSREVTSLLWPHYNRATSLLVYYTIM